MVYSVDQPFLCKLILVTFSDSYICLLFQNEFSYKTGPKGKVPWIEYNGDIYSDSTFIIRHFNTEMGLELNKGLNPEQKAIEHALQKMVEEHMYW